MSTPTPEWEPDPQILWGLEGLADYFYDKKKKHHHQGDYCKKVIGELKGWSARSSAQAATIEQLHKDLGTIQRLADDRAERIAELERDNGNVRGVLKRRQFWYAGGEP